jgi:chemotaxis protein methyltransferase WspC
LSFACRKTDTLKQSSEPSRWSSGQQVHANPPRRAAHSLAPMARSGFFPSMSDAKPAMTSLEKARQLANEGRMAEAAEICEIHLRERGASAEAFYLLGTARHATGADSQAGEYYRKALYLEPTHYDTLMQWALLAERNGDGAHARILQQRAGRIRKPG